MRKEFFMSLFMLFGMVILLSAETTGFKDTSTNTQAVLSEYVACFEKGEEPIEYIFRLFETSDIVILGERDHRDITQYEFICKLIADPRFAARIGYVYTEVGVTNMTQRANELIKGTYRSEAEYRKARTDYLRDEDYQFCWEKTNRSVFIDSLYCINSRLPADRKITLGLTDIAFDWYKAQSPVKYRKWYYKNTVGGPDNKRQLVRDKVMAENFIRQYKRQKPLNGCRKALLITNQPHAVNSKCNKNEGFLIKQAFGNDKVKIVCLNSYSELAPDGTNELTDNGKWDAAFEFTKCKPAAFDIQNTPFGKTVYCNNTIWTPYTGKSWQEYADGIVYDVPFYQFKASIGIDGFVDDGLKEEHMRRLNLMRDAGVISDFNYEDVKRYHNTVRTFPLKAPDVLNKLKEQMEKQLERH